MKRPTLNFDPTIVTANIRNASNEFLLDRITYFREGMEPEAILIIEVELHRRRVTDEEIAEHGRRLREMVIPLDDGTVQPCSFCTRPAIAQGWNWHRLWGKIPIFPRFFSYCEYHQPKSNSEPQGEPPA